MIDLEECIVSVCGETMLMKDLFLQLKGKLNADQALLFVHALLTEKTTKIPGEERSVTMLHVADLSERQIRPN